MQNRLSRALMITALIGVLIASSGCTILSDIMAAFQSEEVFEETLSPDTDLSLDIFNRSGRVNVSPSEDDQLHIRATKRAFRAEDLDRVDITAEEQDGAYIIEAHYLTNDVRVSVDLKIEVPRGMKVGTVENSNGPVQVENVPGDVRVQTTNGNLSLINVAGFVSARTSNGRVEVRNCAGVDEIRSSNGNIYLDIREMRDDVRVRTSNGSIEALVHSNIDAHIDLTTSNGQVSAAHSNLRVLVDETTHLQGTLGEGEFELLLETSNGSIEMQEFGG